MAQPRPSAGATTTITIPQGNGLDPITITTSGGAAQAQGKPVELYEFDEEVTTQVGKVTAGAAGTEATKKEAAPKKEAAAPAAATGNQPATDVAVVYGSFFMGDSKRDAADILAAYPKDCGLSINEAAIEGNNFNFDHLKQTKFLVVCSSSMYGNPPKNFWQFYFHLKAASENPNKPLKGLQYAVYGNGDETYIDTYMNVPRMLDILLEKAGARRFYARGETGEPFTPLNDEMIEAAPWAAGMWKAMATANQADPSVAWDACWQGSKPAHHDKYTDWDLAKLESKFGAPASPSIFAQSRL
jgi:sulfite reductase alpha subunit-like flavoprotein